MSLLKGYLTTYASQIISHQTIEDQNFDVALKLLKEEFLDISFIIDEIYKQIINTSPKFDTNYNYVKQYLAEIKLDLSELNTSYDKIFFEESESGFLFISHIMFSKLPGILQKVLTSKVEYRTLHSYKLFWAVCHLFPQR